MSFNYHLREQTLTLLPEKAIYWNDRRCLIIADVHLGKTSHFRKSGIAIPNLLQQTDIQRLTDLIDKTDPAMIIFLGDLFHSEKNKEWHLFEEWRNKHSQIEIHLVKGNHDIISPDHYHELRIAVHMDELNMEPFIFLHEPVNESDIDTNDYYLSGHLHPGFLLSGKAKQHITLSCFYFGAKQGVLPAFGRFTGKAKIEIKENDKIFCISGEEVIAL